MKDKAPYIVFILTHGRPEGVKTYHTLKRLGYTGQIRLIVDDLDKTKDQYLEKYPGEVIVFDKKKAAELFDAGDNFDTFRGVIYARNEAFNIAERLGFEYFIMLDDDYKELRFRFNDRLNYEYRLIIDLDTVFEHLLEFFITSGVDSFAIAQGGDFIGGESNKQYADHIRLTRKLMNLYVLSTKRRFEFMGRINEDVNVYTNLGCRGKVFFTTNQLSLEQMQTQANTGGMTELYLDSGTYVKSFYSVIFQPSFVSVATLQDREHARLHHRVKWKHGIPKILSESQRATPSSRK